MLKTSTLTFSRHFEYIYLPLHFRQPNFTRNVTLAAMSRILFVLLSVCLLHYCASACEHIQNRQDYTKCKFGSYIHIKRSRMNKINDNNDIQSDRLLSRSFTREGGSFMTPVSTLSLWRLYVSSGDAAESRIRYFKRYALYR